MREKEYRKNRKGGRTRKSKFKEKDRDKFRERENDKENVDKPDSKEPSPPESVKADTEKEFVPAPLPKSNPWKKPSSNKSDSNAEGVGDKQKPKVERKKKNSERDTKEHAVQQAKSHHHHSRGNPWKKVEVELSVEMEAGQEQDSAGRPSSPKVTKVDRKEGEGSWPKPGEEKPVKGKRVKSGDSADSGAASSLETEEGKEVRLGGRRRRRVICLICLLNFRRTTESVRRRTMTQARRKRKEGVSTVCCFSRFLRPTQC